MNSSPENTAGDIIGLLAGGRGNVHFVGVCGVGMAGLAYMVRGMGFTVTGCDVALNPLATWLADQGIDVQEGHHPEHMDEGAVFVVRSAAVPDDADELVFARGKGIPVFRRGEVLPALLTFRPSIAVCGTHGKTTTSSFIAQVLRSAGRDPSWCIGGQVDGSSGMSVAARGGGKMVVVEADESDGTLSLYHPDVTVVNNIEFDHMEHFESRESFEDCFRKIMAQTRQRIIYCLDDPRAAEVCGWSANAMSFGFSEEADIHAAEVIEKDSAQSFLLVLRGKDLGRVELPMPGRHNILNALAAAGVGMEVGLSFSEVKKGLAAVCLPLRRFEKVVDRDGVRVISDYAHHPSEISALVSMVGRCERLLAVFQPHRYSRTRALGAQFPAAFEGVDEIILLPVYAASESPVPGGTVWDMYEHFRRLGARGTDVTLAVSMEKAWTFLKPRLRNGDVLLVVGAGDVEQVARWARDTFAKPAPPHRPSAEEIVGLLAPGLTNTTVRRDEPLAGKTTLGVGGRADLWLEVGSVKDLTHILQVAQREHVPFHLLGAGSNVLVSDLGVRGIAARLTGECFSEIRVTEEGHKQGELVAGVGVSLARLLAWAEQNDLGGLEFLEGIPGSVGGGAKMNAGAAGKSMSDYVSWIRCLNPDGRECIVGASELKPSYRSCLGLKEKVVVEVGLCLPVEDRQLIHERRKILAAKREWMRGLRSAGSVFKNPKCVTAGRLLDEAGLKGVKVGGAGVSPDHANVIVTEAGANASDVLALIGIMRSRALALHGVGLEMEVDFWE